jgi:hypothetical protein
MLQSLQLQENSTREDLKMIRSEDK